MPEYFGRADGRVERVCSHGVGHTVHVPEPYTDDWAWWSHGCDRCCQPEWRHKYQHGKDKVV